jgi:uncharacterized delta-60 repeat protein
MDQKGNNIFKASNYCLHIMIFIILSIIPGITAAIDGRLDPGFHGNGKLVNPITLGGIPEVVQFLDVAVQRDGRIVVAGGLDPVPSDSGSVDWLLVRYLSNGAIDTGFGPSFGLSMLSFDRGAGNADTARRVLILPDGKILVLGDVAGGQLASGTPGDHSFALARFDSNGILDSSFGNGGAHVVSNLAPAALYATDLLLGPDGDYVVIANSRVPASVGTGPSISVFAYHPSNLAFRFKSINFDLDSFKDDSAAAARFTADGKLVVVGSASFNVGSNTSDYDYAIARLNYSDFSFDTSFSGDGKVTVDMQCGGTRSNDRAVDVSPQPDGGLIVAGNCSIDDSGADKIGVIRLLASGTRDGGFGGDPDGKLIFSFGNNSSIYSNQMSRMLTQGDGKMLLIGSADSDNTTSPDTGILRLLPNGQTDDAGFQTNTTGSLPGRGLINFVTSAVSGSFADWGYSAAFDGGRVVIVGNSVVTALGRAGDVARLGFDQIFIDRFEGP